MARLVLVPTPIGNLGDITARAVEVLQAADTVAAEDTRRSANLLTHLNISRPLVRLDAHTIPERAPRLLDGEGTLAFITDAGTPGISDPGAELVRMALDRGLDVEVLPGATAFVPALVLSGLDTARFTFEGFLPRKGSSRNERLTQIAAARGTSIIYEAPQRVQATLTDLAAVCGDGRRASVSRELSKRFEETLRGTLAELAVLAGESDPRGEYVICVAASDEPQAGADTARFRELGNLLSGAGLGRREVREALILAGASRNDAYGFSLTVRTGDLK